MFGAVALLEYIARVVVALQNYAALGEEPQRILSAYSTSDGTKVWIITEWDRSYTTVLLPKDY